VAVILELNDVEALALARALDSYLPELAEEAARTDSQRNHEQWDRYRALEIVREKLAAMRAAEAEPAAGF
jgi:hypothetical protein